MVMAQNLVTLIRTRQRRNARRRQTAAVVEGVRLVEESLDVGLDFEGAVVSPAIERTERGAQLLESLRRAGVPVDEVTDRELDGLADTDTPQGIVAVVEPPVWTVQDLAAKAGAPILVLDGVQDPGNVGALIRTASALGGGGVVLLPGNARLTHPKVLRAAMGTSFRLPVVPLGTEEFREWLVDEDVTLWATSSTGRPVADMSRPERLAVLVGNEGAGIGSDLETLAAVTVGVPIAQDVESLNVAVAAGIILHEVARHG
jgi:TrmH family RNA methyltransferase